MVFGGSSAFVLLPHPYLIHICSALGLQSTLWHLSSMIAQCRRCLGGVIVAEFTTAFEASMGLHHR